MKETFVTVGNLSARLDGVEKVTGQAKYTGDIALSGLLEGKVLRSPFPHATIESIDASKAEALPGVVAVLTRDDLNDINPYYGHCLRDRPLIAIDRVRYVGEPVAVVAAENRDIANAALSLIEVHYGELSCLATVEDALAQGAPLLHENVAGVGEFHEMAGVGKEEKSNVCHHEHFEKGDASKGFAEADEIVDETYEFPMIYHYTMEPHTTVAQSDTRRYHALDLFGSSIPGPVRACPHVRLSPLQSRSHRSLRRRRLRWKILLQNRAHGRGHGAEDRRPARAGGAKRFRVDAHHPPPFGDNVGSGPA